MKFLQHLTLLVLSFLTFSGMFSSQESFARGNASILQVARSQIGVREYRGRGSNPRITRYFRKAVGRSYSDSMPWCSAFINYVIKTAGHRGTNSLSARSWTRWGRRTSSPRPGDIVVFSRRRGGHVGIFLGFSGNRVRVIGGNQSNSVSVKSYPRRRVISYRTSGVRSSRPSKRRLARSRSKSRKARLYRTARGKTRRAKRNKLRRAKRSLARRLAANQRRKKRTNKAKAIKRTRVAKLKRKKRYKKKIKKQSYQQPQYYQQPQAPAPNSVGSYRVDGTLG